MKTKKTKLIVLLISTTIGVSLLLFIVLPDSFDIIKHLMGLIVLPLWGFSIIPSIMYVISNFKDKKEMEIESDSIWSLLLLPVVIAPVFMVKYYKLKKEDNDYFGNTN